MSNVQAIARKQIVSDSIIETMEHYIEELKKGAITDFVFVADDPSGGVFYRASDFTDAWRLVGALAYAQQLVLDGMGKK